MADESVEPLSMTSFTISMMLSYWYVCSYNLYNFLKQWYQMKNGIQ